jgi:SAM-dependent methyltransferase
MPAIIELDRPARQGSSLQQGSTFVDRLRTRLVQREILKRLARSGSLRFLDLGCGYHATCLRAIHKAIGDRLAEGLGVDFQVGEESRRHPRLRFVTASVEDALPELPCNAFDAVLKPGGRLLVNVPPWYAKPVLEMSAFHLGTSPACAIDEHKMYYWNRDLWPLLVRARLKRARIRLYWPSYA